MEITTIFDDDSRTNPPYDHIESVQMFCTTNIITDLDLMVNLSPIHNSTNQLMDDTQKNDKKKLQLKIKSSIQQHPKKVQLKIKSSTQVPDGVQKLSIKTEPKIKNESIKIQPYKCIKLPLKTILQKQSNDPDKRVMILINDSSVQKQIQTQIRVIDNSTILQKINEAVMRTNRIIIKTYLLLRLWILYKYHQQPDTLIMNKIVIKMAMQVICSTKDGARKTKEKKYQVPSDQQKKQFKDQCYRELQELNPFPPENAEHLSHILKVYQYHFENSIFRVTD
jgi:hypothetical protein